eukprot:gnl/TRDRNA2_/TRDRNA2_175104_c8_seq2.p1 gnl/TRDRNA2_/TRDRNA2_175104_c8~~gnl/TRDRNA2_/TRDRNA2_175104_c8_seq2.p1  ORF type:complete len:427 (-),score=41.89 gnl/TRDRNA2_/TRDRNA2_175104_c8_seq2:212-1492(-)
MGASSQMGDQELNIDRALNQTFQARVTQHKQANRTNSKKEQSAVHRDSKPGKSMDAFMPSRESSGPFKMALSQKGSVSFTEGDQKLANTIRQFTYLSSQQHDFRWLHHAAPESHSSSNSSKCKKNKLAVCVVGQLSRLETDSKIKNFLEPEAAVRGANNVHAFFIMEAGSDFFANTISLPDNTSDCHQDFHNATEVQQIFAPFYRGGLYLSHVNWTLRLNHWHRYCQEKPHLRSRRMQSHFSQWHHWYECSSLIKKQEQKMGCEYESIARLRDNGVVTKPMSFDIRNLTKPLVKDCNCWQGGYNDKFVIAPRKDMETILEGNFALAVKVNSGDSDAVDYISKVVTPELFTKRTWEALGVEAALDPNSTHITVVDGRCVSPPLNLLLSEENRTTRTGRKFCLVERWKDCRPPGNMTYPTCHTITGPQ